MNNKIKQLITSDVLEKYYVQQSLTPYEIAKLFSCNHKTIRTYLKKFNIPLRTQSEYNSLSHKTYTEPSQELLFSPLSLVLHSIYICEGGTSSGVKSLCFCNQDVQLITTFCKGIQKIYYYKSPLNISLQYNFECNNSLQIINHYESILSTLKNYKIVKKHRTERKNPIIYVNVGGNRLMELFLKNIEKVLK